MTGAAEFDCEAYGPEARKLGAHCFLAGLDERACSTRAECAASMGGERRRLFRRIKELAAADEKNEGPWSALSAELTDPEQLLAGWLAERKEPRE